MRYIAVFLLLANVVYFSWNQYTARDAALGPTPVTIPPINNGLNLLSERNGSVELPEAGVAQAAVVSGYCALVGLFRNLDDANYFMLGAQKLGIDTELKLSGELLSPQYRVYILPLSSREEATSTLIGLNEELRDAELAIESYLITRGELGNGIALGVFDQLSNAEGVQSQALELGYSPEIGEIPRADGDIRVQLMLDNQFPFETDQWLELTRDRPYLTQVENLCETIAQGQ
jgi:hypothetical protein